MITRETLRLFLLIALGLILFVAVVMLITFFVRRRREKSFHEADTHGLDKLFDDEATVGMDWAGNEATIDKGWSDGEKTIGKDWSEEEATIGKNWSEGEATIGKNWSDDEVTIGKDWSEDEATIGRGWDPEQTIATDWDAEEASAANGMRPEVKAGRMTAQMTSRLHGIDLEKTLTLDEWQPKAELRFNVEEEQSTYEKTIRFASSMTVGREKTCDLHLTEQYVSRQHLLITRTGKQLTVKNLVDGKAKDYTLLNGQAMSDDPVPLNEGDVLEIADVRLVLHIVRL